MKTGSIASIVKDGREALGLSQVDFAARIGASYSSVQKWESGKATPSPQFIRRMWLLFGYADPFPQLAKDKWRPKGENGGTRVLLDALSSRSALVA